MKIKREDIEDTITILEEILAEMEIRNVDEVKTESNTYFCGSQFISYGSNGFLDLSSAIDNIIAESEEKDYE